MADANHKARSSRAKRARTITVTLRDMPDGYSPDTPIRPQQPFMPWEHIDRWLGASSFFSPGQRVYVSVDHAHQCLTVTPEYDDAATAREREAFAIERTAANEELRKVWRAQTKGQCWRQHNATKCAVAIERDSVKCRGRA